MEISVPSAVLLSSVTTTGSQATVDFTSIPSGYRHLVVKIRARSTKVAQTEDMYVKVNNDGTAGNYSSQLLYGTGASAFAGTVAGSSSGAFVVTLYAASSTASLACGGTMEFPFYADTTYKKNGVYSGGSYDGSANTFLNTNASWFSAAAISRLTFSVATGIVDGSLFVLYGIS